MVKTPDNGAQHSPDHIEQIRDSIFGPQKRQYEQRFQQKTADLYKYQGEVRAHTDKRFDSLRNRLEEKLASTTADFTARA